MGNAHVTHGGNGKNKTANGKDEVRNGDGFRRRLDGSSEDAASRELVKSTNHWPLCYRAINVWL
jgi:hypothetical protein